MSRTRYTLGFDRHNMVPGPDGVVDVFIIYRSEDGILKCYGTTVPSDANKFAEGCLFYKVNATSDDVLYVNNGTYASPDFELVLNVDNIISQIEDDGYLSGTAAGVGPSPAIWDSVPLLDVMLDPTKGWHDFEDFLSFEYTTAESILITQTGVEGTIATDPTVPGGIADIDTGGSTAADGPTIQFTGHQITPQAGTTIYFECRVKVSVDDSRWVIGLADDAVTDYVSDDTIGISNDIAAFYRDSSATSTDDVNTISSRGAAEDVDADIIEAMANDEYVKFGIVIDGLTSVKFYHEGVLVNTVSAAANIPNVAICPIFQVNVDTGQAHIYVDWMRILVHDADGTCRTS